MKSARAVNSAWEIVRDEVLRAHPWNSCITRTQLAALTPGPTFGWDYHYQLPTDCLRVLDVGHPEETQLPWEVNGKILLTDEGAPVDLRYVKREEDAGQYDALLVSAMAARLAVEVCEELTQSTTKKQVVADEYQAILAEARRADGQEHYTSEHELDSWLQARL